MLEKIEKNFVPKKVLNDLVKLYHEQKFSIILEREKRSHLLSPILKFLPTRVKLDLQGWDNLDLFSHS